jgi:glycogen debranching enzyme
MIPDECAHAATGHVVRLAADSSMRVTYWIHTGAVDTPSQTFPAEIAAWQSIKVARYKELMARSAVSVPDKELERALVWMKPQVDWLVRTVPEIGTGIGAGVPEYPWWFGCDSHYAVKGVLAFGQHQWAKDTMKLLDAVSWRRNTDGRIIHEVSTTGAVYNPGNAQESPQYCDARWETFCWPGDEEWLRERYDSVARAMNWVLDADDWGDDLTPGYGIIEIEGLNLSADA